MPYRNTSIEIKIQKQLDTIGIRYITDVRSLEGRPDILIENTKTIIFADGCMWHQCSLCGFYTNAIGTQFEGYGDSIELHDLEVTRYLANEGYKVIRIWEHHIRKSEFSITGYLNELKISRQVDNAFLEKRINEILEYTAKLAREEINKKLLFKVQ